MERRSLLAIGAGMLGLSIAGRAAGDSAGASAAPPTWRWGVDYGAATDPVLARACDLLVLEPHHARDIARLRGPRSTLLGYASFGEVEKSRPYFAELLRAGALGPANPNWPDARMADLRSAAWRDVVIGRIIPEILALGYDGIFIDTMDNAEAMEHQDPSANAGMVAAGAALVVAVRAAFPRIGIMLNRGYAVLPQVATAIDHVLGEAMASRWNFGAKRYERLSDSDWTWQAERLRAAKLLNPRLTLATLDYWDPADKAGVAALYARERAAGFAPYVATLALDRLIAEPIASRSGK